MVESSDSGGKRKETGGELKIYLRPLRNRVLLES